MEIHILRVFLAGLGAFVAYMAIGSILFAGMGWLKDAFKKYPNVYREEVELMKLMPLGMLAMFVSMLVLALLYAHLPPLASGWVQGTCFGVLIATFVLCGFVIHNHVNLRVGWKLTIGSGTAYFIEWTVAGMAIGLIYNW